MFEFWGSFLPMSPDSYSGGGSLGDFDLSVPFELRSGSIRESEWKSVLKVC